MYCPNCKNEISENEIYCRHCGKSIYEPAAFENYGKNNYENGYNNYDEAEIQSYYDDIGETEAYSKENGDFNTDYYKSGNQYGSGGKQPDGKKRAIIVLVIVFSSVVLISAIAGFQMLFGGGKSNEKRENRDDKSASERADKDDNSIIRFESAESSDVSEISDEKSSLASESSRATSFSAFTSRTVSSGLSQQKTSSAVYDTEAATASKTVSNETLYAEFLKNRLEKKYGYLAAGDISGKGITTTEVCDLNNDGKSELVVGIFENKAFSVDVYTVKNGKVGAPTQVYLEKCEGDSNCAADINLYISGKTRKRIFLDFEFYSFGGSSISKSIAVYTYNSENSFEKNFNANIYGGRGSVEYTIENYGKSVFTKNYYESFDNESDDINTIESEFNKIIAKNSAEYGFSYTGKMRYLGVTDGSETNIYKTTEKHKILRFGYDKNFNRPEGYKVFYIEENLKWDYK